MKITALALVAVLAVGSNAVAADPLPTEIALARRLFAEARASEDAKDWSTAANKLREAIAIKETAGLRFHLAYCEEQQGKLVEALVDYERSEDLPGGTHDDFRAQLPAKRESLHRRIPTVNLMLPPEATDVTLTVDDHVLPTNFLGKPVPLNPGKHTLLIAAPGYQRFVTEVNLKEADAVVSNVLLTPQSTTPAEKAATPPVVPVRSADTSPRASGVSTARTVVLIGEAAVLVGGLAVGIGATMAKSSKDTQIEHDQAFLKTTGCFGSANPAKCSELEQDTRDRAHWVSVSEIGFVAAGVGLLGFATTLLLWPSGRYSTASSSARIVPVLSQQLAGMSISGAF
jgi:hypothetical protein